MPKLRANERCPLHGRRDCCGRTATAKAKHELKYQQIAPGVRLYPGKREVCSLAVLRRRKHQMLASHPVCEACGEKFENYSQVELGHRVQKGMGGSKRRDNQDNLILLHYGANREQGSMDFDYYMNNCYHPEHCQ